ncbi:hypothetical protein GGX14DRAFT_556706 [Mycena pura]|uniref:Uncharacterized protein n=1 Tax=Mycena pura TaxID=153505 RepID=A0AAD6YQ75_9AGAR|nr:hypothetical protein GGX14DRAFT_556706 [Mycena pura]
MARKPRPHVIVLDRDSAPEYTTFIVQSPNIDSRAVSPDFNSRPVSFVSDCSSSDNVAVGFGRKRHFVLPTMPAPAHTVTQSTVVEFGRKKRHFISVPPSSSITLTRRHENRRSLPNLPPFYETTRTPNILGLCLSRLCFLDKSSRAHRSRAASNGPSSAASVMLSPFAWLRQLRLRRLSLVRLASVDDEMERAQEGFIKQLKNLHHLYCYLRAIARL